MPAWLTTRTLQAPDASSARALVATQFGGTVYESRILEQLESAARGGDAEHRGLVAFARGDDRMAGLALFGAVAGAHGVSKIHALAGSDRNVLVALAGAVRAEGVRAGDRMVVCEIPDDAPYEVTLDALRELGFEEGGRVADYFREGVALLVLTRQSI